MLASFLLWGLMIVGGWLFFCVAKMVWFDIRVNRVQPEFLQRRVGNHMGGLANFKLKPGDEIWWYSTPVYMWRSRCGRAGYAQVRKGKVIKKIKILVN